MRWGLITQWYEPEPAVLTPSLARTLATHGHEVKVLTGYPNYPTGRIYPGFAQRWRTRSSADGVEVLRVPLIAGHGVSATSRIANLTSFAVSASTATAFLRDVDALWVYSSPPMVALPAWLAKMRSHAPLITHVMDLWPDSIYGGGFLPSVSRDGRRASALARVVSTGYRGADIVGYISPGVGGRLQEMGVDPGVLRYLPLWTDESRFHPGPADPLLAEHLGLAGKRIILYAGVVGGAQGLSRVVDAMAAVQDEPDLVLVIIGSGTRIAEVTRAAARLSNVRVLPEVPVDEVLAYLHLGDVHLVSLQPSAIGAISTPGKMPIAMACGRPMLVVADGDAASVGRSTQSSWIASPTDPKSIEKALRAIAQASPEELARRAVMSRAYYESHYSSEAAVDRLLSAYASVR